MKTSALVFATAVLASLPAPAVEPSTPLISAGPVVVTARDFEAQMLRIPPDLWRESRATLDRVAQMTDTLFVNRVLALEAKKAGLLDDPLVVARTQQVVEAYQARLVLENMEKNLGATILEARAREIYLSDRAKYKVPERFEVEHLLVNLWGRTKEMALAQIKEARGKLASGANLAAIVKEYGSDISNPRQPLPTGKLGVVAASSLDAAIGTRLPGLKVGEWSEPIETRAGWHIVRVVAKIPGADIPFEQVKDAIIEEERAKAVKKATEEKLQAIRNQPGTKVDTAALESLVMPVSKEEIEALHRKKQEATKSRPAQ